MRNRLLFALLFMENSPSTRTHPLAPIAPPGISTDATTVSEVVAPTALCTLDCPATSHVDRLATAPCAVLAPVPPLVTARSAPLQSLLLTVDAVARLPRYPLRTSSSFALGLVPQQGCPSLST